MDQRVLFINCYRAQDFEGCEVRQHFLDLFEHLVVEPFIVADVKLLQRRADYLFGTQIVQPSEVEVIVHTVHRPQH